MAERSQSQDRELVQALMLQGWYRDGHGRTDAVGKRPWRFRSGHCLEDSQRQTIIMRARSERGAMRGLLEHLRQRSENDTAPMLTAQ